MTCGSSVVLNGPEQCIGTSVYLDPFEGRAGKGKEALDHWVYTLISAVGC